MIRLNDSTIKLISSSYVISSIEVLVKELVENSLDAGSSRIWINLKRFGLDKIDVIDDGSGIGDASLICQRYCTSKISNYSDIENVDTFGFRGEVLSSICAVSNLTIISNRDANLSPMGNIWVFDKLGNVKASVPTSCNQGTTISVANIFHNLPVRCQMYKSLFMLQRSLKLITRYLEQLYLSRSNIQIKLSNDNSTILNLHMCSSRKESISLVIGPSKFKSFIETTNSMSVMGLNLFVPNTFDDKSGLTNRDYKENCYLFINDRPADVPVLFKALRTAYNNFINDNSNRYPSAFLYLTLPPHWVDVNADPEKRKLKLCNINDITEFIANTVKHLYESTRSNNIPENIENPDSCVAFDHLSTTPAELTGSSDLTVNGEIPSSIDKPVSSETEIGKDRDIGALTEMSELNKDIDIAFEGNYALGRMPDIEEPPVRSVNLKRIMPTNTDGDGPPHKLHNTERRCEVISTALVENKQPESDIIESSLQKEYTAHLSLTSLKLENLSQTNFIPQDLHVISHWDSFVISMEKKTPGSVKKTEVSDLVIFRKRDVISASIYLENMARMQIPSMTLDKPIAINNEKLLEALEKLPTQLIQNVKSEKQFYVISCPNILKNGYRIHCMKTDEKSRYKIINVPVCVEEAIILDEIGFILEHVDSTTNVRRTATSSRWIYSNSVDTAESKYNSELKKLTGKRLCEYLNCCMQKIYKHRLEDKLDEYLPELFRFNLNKC